MNDEFMLTSSLDQPLPTSPDWIERRVDEIVEKSIRENNVYIALNACRELVAVSKLSGLGLARFLYLIKKNWNKYNTDEPFEDIVYSYIGVHQHTVERYVRVYTMLVEHVGPEVSQKLKQHNMNMLVPVANAISQGFEVTNEQWEKIIEAPDANAVAHIVRTEIKEIPPRKNMLAIIFHAEDGTIWAWREGKKYYIGKLEVESEDTPVKNAIERIVNYTRMIIK